MFLNTASNADSLIENDSSDTKNEQLQEIWQWLEQNPYINACKDLENLLFFLSCCKFDVERTKKKIKGFYQMRAERVEWFSNRDPFLAEIQDILKLGVFLPVDGLDVENYKVVIIRTSAHDPKLHTQNNVFKVGKMILDLVIKYEPDHCANGIIAIFDMKNVQLGHALQLNPKIIKRSVHSWTAYPCQPKLLEFVNSPRHVNIILNTFRFFMTPKMRSRLIVQKRGSSVQCEHLPKDLGGNGPTYEELTLKWKHLVEENYAFFKENEKYKMILNK